jgi:hypothetical protein
MATRSVVGYETESGGYVGVYCHFDGYPSNMLPQLESMSWEDVKSGVDRALYEGAGARQLRNNKFQIYNELPNPTSWGTFVWPHQKEEYNYFKKLDGTVEHIAWNDIL